MYSITYAILLYRITLALSLRTMNNNGIPKIFPALSKLFCDNYSQDKTFELTPRSPSSFEILGECGSTDLECLLPGREIFGNPGIAFAGPSSHQVKFSWKERPKRILLLAKPDPDAISSLKEAMLYLRRKGVDILLESSVFYQLDNHDLDPIKSSENESLGVVGVFNENLRKGIDLIVTFGGDGLLMHCNTVFGRSGLPPIMCFDFGSLGFLAPFSFDDFEKEVIIEFMHIYI